MRLALAQARRAEGRTHPNPGVGAVVFRGDRVLGRGCTRPPGGPHAEVVALRAATRRHGARAVRGASLAVTLEPCDHQGRTGPCTQALIDAGLARVYAGHRDPAPHARGRGLRRLRAAGIRVALGVLEAACRQQNRGYLCVLTRGRPHVTLKLAASLDGRIAAASGDSRWISGPRSREHVHALRARIDAVAVGAETALADDPALTARRGRRVVARPVRVVFDSRLRVGPGARLHRAPGESWTVCHRAAPAARRRALEQRGVRVLAVGASPGGVDLPAALSQLAEAGLTRLLVEGGGSLAAALLREDLVDEVHWFVAPRLVGGDGVAAVGELALARLGAAPALEDVRVRRSGDDVWVHGRIRRRGEAW